MRGWQREAVGNQRFFFPSLQRAQRGVNPALMHLAAVQQMFDSLRMIGERFNAAGTALPRNLGGVLQETKCNLHHYSTAFIEIPITVSRSFCVLCLANQLSVLFVSMRKVARERVSLMTSAGMQRNIFWKNIFMLNPLMPTASAQHPPDDEAEGHPRWPKKA